MTQFVRDHRDLDVYKLAMDLAESSYRTTRALPKDEVYGLVAQIRRASVSIACNLAEGAGRNHRGEFLQFVGVAAGSQAELLTLLTIARRIYPDIDFKSEIQETARLGMMLVRLKAALRTSKSSVA